ncbi:hypothetical protein HDU67_006947 [Dinochytrium kinnereticum]|nr:hypothetical protein HDU67_006947 [Dinochytrium kinnereticum]
MDDYIQHRTPNDQKPLILRNMSASLYPSSVAYSQVSIITNMMRAINVGYSLSVISMCSIILNFTNRSTSGALLPLISAVFLLAANMAFMLIDVIKPACPGRAVGIYVFVYLSQICLEVYQSNRMRMLSLGNVIARSAAYALFIIRASSLPVLLYYYSDAENTTNHICITVFPPTALMIEKAILIFYNIGNLLILIYLSQTAQSEKKPGKMVFKTLLITFLVQDGLTFIAALILDSAYLTVILTVSAPWIMSLAAGLANGFNLAILHIKYCAEVKVVILALMKTPSPKTVCGSGLGKEMKYQNEPTVSGYFSV